MNQITDFLGSLTLLDPITHRTLTLIPVRDGGRAAFPYLLLEEALEAGGFRIGEIGGGTVPELMLFNSTDHRVFLMGGEELVGAKQNRILNTSVMVEARSSVPIPVSCVEAHRWSVHDPWMRKGSISYPELRYAKTRHVHESLRRDSNYAADQGEVWRHVDMKLAAHRVHSQTASMEEIFVQRREGLKSFRQGFPYPQGASGVVAAVGARIVCADFFDSPDTLRKLWDRLVESYTLDAMEDPIGGAAPDTSTASRAPAAPRPLPPGRLAILSFLRMPKDALVEPFDSPGIGTSLRITAGRKAGSALVCDGKVIHLELFGPDAAGPARGPRTSR